MNFNRLETQQMDIYWDKSGRRIRRPLRRREEPPPPPAPKTLQWANETYDTYYR